MDEYIEREDLMAENAYKNVEKIKTTFAKIIVDGTAEKPYYSILWLDEENKEYNVGYSSYCLDYVFEWMEEVFEIVAADEPHEPQIEDVAPVQKWISVKESLPRDSDCVLVIASGKFENITLENAIEIATFDMSEGWILEMWPEWENPNVTYWMPLLEPPKEDDDGK